MAPQLDVLTKLKRQRPESDRLAAILEYLLLVPTSHVWRQNVGAATFTDASGKSRHVAFGIQGLPDICGWIERWAGRVDARPLYLEVKREGGRRRPHQRLFIELAQRTGCIAGFVTCVAEVQALLRQHGVTCP